MVLHLQASNIDTYMHIRYDTHTYVYVRRAYADIRNARITAYINAYTQVAQLYAYKRDSFYTGSHTTCMSYKCRLVATAMHTKGLARLDMHWQYPVHTTTVEKSQLQYITYVP